MKTFIPHHLVCKSCDRVITMFLDEGDYKKYKDGSLTLEEAMSYLDPDEKEFFLLGKCQDCLE